MANAPDVHAGLSDVEEDLDIGAMVREAATDRESGNPINRAAERLRGDATDDVDGEGDDPSPQSKKKDEAAEDEPTEEEQEELDRLESEKTDEDTEEEEAGGEEAEGDEDEESDEPAAKFEVEVGSLDPALKDTKFVFALESQEQHDVLVSHLRRSEQLDVVRAQLADAQEHEEVSTFVQQHPLTAMLLFDREDAKAKHPERLGEQFTERWIRANPERAVELLTKKLGFQIDAKQLDMDRMKDRGESADLKTEREINATLGDHKKVTANQRFIAETSATLRDIAGKAELGEGDDEAFYALAAREIKKVHDSRRANGRDPRLTRNEVLKLVQPVLKRFVQGNGAAAATTSTKAGARAKDTTVDPAKKFKEREERRDKHRKVGGAGAGSSPSVASIRGTKFKGTVGVKAAAAKLRTT